MKHRNQNRFHRDEEGGITLFIIAMFLLMVVAGGMAIDFMRHESERVRFQDAMDRGVLSAASLKQVDAYGVEYNDPSDVVTSYLRAEGYEVDSTDMAIAVITPDSNNISSRQVDAAAEYSINTFFLRLINIPTLTVAAYSSAAVEYSQVELSLVLDISGSMGGTPDSCTRNCISKLASLKIAATNFVNQVITDDNVDRTTMSIIPFSATVNVGQQIAEEYSGLNAWHDYSYCFDFARPDDNDPLTDGNDYLTTAVAPTTVYQQAQHWSLNGNSTFWCPRDNNKVVALSNNRDLLQYTIESLQEEIYTSQWMGVKWGAALLNPAFNPVTVALTNKTQTIPIFDSNGNATNNTENVPTVESIFNDRPTMFVGGAQKYLVLMSDGDNTVHAQIKPEMYNQTEGVTALKGVSDWRTQANADWWNNQRNNTTQYGWYYERVCTRYWNNGSCRQYGNAWTLGYSDISSGVPEPDGNWTSYNSDMDRDFHVDSGEGDDLQQDICSAAKTQGIKIYTIGFDISSPNVPDGTVLTPAQVDDLGSSYGAYKALYRCASSGSEFYDVADADELEQAFSAIASNVARLKLLD